MYKYICCAKPFIDQEPEFRTLLGVKEDNEAKRRNRKKIFIVDDDEGKLNAIKECMREIFLDAAIFTYTCLRDIYHVIFHIRGGKGYWHIKGTAFLYVTIMLSDRHIQKTAWNVGGIS